MVPFFISLGFILFIIVLIWLSNTPKAKARRKERVTRLQEKRGAQGEKAIESFLERLKCEGDQVFHSLLVPTYSHGKTEVDFVLISTKGLFCIEAKNWVGEIKGDDNDEQWVQIYDDPLNPNRIHRNPVIQNEKHCDIIFNYLGQQYPIKNIVLFKFLEYPKSLSSQHTFDMRSFKRYFRSLPDEELSAEDIKDIYEDLSDCVPTEEELAKYRQKLKDKHRTINH